MERRERLIDNDDHNQIKQVRVSTAQGKIENIVREFLLYLQKNEVPKIAFDQDNKESGNR
jgi:hypothetical protein